MRKNNVVKDWFPLFGHIVNTKLTLRDSWLDTTDKIKVTYHGGHDEGTMVEAVEVAHHKQQVGRLFHREEPEEVNVSNCIDHCFCLWLWQSCDLLLGTLIYWYYWCYYWYCCFWLWQSCDLLLGTLIPRALSKHFMAAPTAVSSWYTFKPPSRDCNETRLVGNIKLWRCTYCNIIIVLIRNKLYF